MSKLVSKSVALADAVAEHHGDGDEEESGASVVTLPPHHIVTMPIASSLVGTVERE